MGITASRLKMVHKHESQLKEAGAAASMSWMLQSAESEQLQSAYHIQAASAQEQLLLGKPDLWDSGVVVSGQSLHVDYKGLLPRSGKQCWWRVRVWDKSGAPSEWSDAAVWTQARLEPSEWTAKWIGNVNRKELELPPASYLRKAFQMDRHVKNATAYASALGLYELRINGKRATDERFAPGWTDYHTRVQYQACDVTHLLHQGSNAIGMILGTGWYAGYLGMMGRQVYGESPRLLFQLHLAYEDGSEEWLISDASWKMSKGPILYSDIIKGEKYDARLAQSGWDEPGFQDGEWEQPHCFEPYEGELTLQLDPPIRVMEQIRPLSVRKTERGSYIYDLGQNIAGWTRLQMSGRSGQEITVRHAEMLDADGSLYLANLRKAVQTDIYILRGDEAEELEPHFTYHGFRYVEVDGAEGELTLDQLIGLAAYSAAEASGWVETSDELINQLYSNIVWGQKGNFFSVPTDCPQRDERLGWTGDAQIFVRTACYNMNVEAFFQKYMVDVADAQREDGAFPDTAPDANWSYFKQVSSAKWFAPDNAGWGDAGVIIPWTLYLMYGDAAILKQYYDRMKQWVDYLKANSDDLIRPDYADHADWLSVNADTPKDVLATQYFAYSTRLFARIAALVGNEEDAASYDELFEQIKMAFTSEFVTMDGIIEGDTQTVYALALYFGLLTEELGEKSAQRLVQLIEENGNHLSTGFLGVGYLLPVLSEIGQNELAYTLLQQESYPSWLYSVKHGATTIWERWDGWTEHGGFQSPSMNSFNHYSLGSVGEWMFRYMAGLDPDPQQPGFKHIRFQPRPGGTLRNVKAHYESGYGRIEASWEYDEQQGMTIKLSLPPNTTASVILPGPAVRAQGQAYSLEAGGLHYEVGSGAYTFYCVQTEKRKEKQAHE
ncbi:family 78 glycoside hydrolase catalytic domain [Paenibacillus arenilitoris]|uniref:family 78 glycoside hydrolase catalytic domain n=1 Tax=Paenibacillus arenilitoris TaxID=2772299 RepID=UPI00295B15E7|nr:family 78 glycoside hydrolase catalytic domain [Paenibacillus arenilitoris]